MKETESRVKKAIKLVECGIHPFDYRIDSSLPNWESHWKPSLLRGLNESLRWIADENKKDRHTHRSDKA